METADYIWLNGEFVAWPDAKIHVLTHALHYGSGVFEGIRAYETDRGPAIFRHQDHLDRLKKSAEHYHIDMPYTVDELREATHELIRRNGFQSCYIRPLVYRGYGEMGLFPLTTPVEAMIAVWPWEAYLGEDGKAEGIHVTISRWQRISPNSLVPEGKATGPYLNSILAKVETAEAGFQEAIMLDGEENVCEGTGENIFLVFGEELVTPSVEFSLLPGVTRDSVNTIATDLGYKVSERRVPKAELFQADEIFMTGTAAEIVPVRAIDDHQIGPPGPVTKAVQKVYFDAIVGEREKYMGWLDFVETDATTPGENESALAS